MYAQAVEAILRDHAGAAFVRTVEAGGSPAPLRDALADTGFLELLAEESAGGAGLGMQEFHAVVLLCGSWAVPLPLAHTMIVRLMLPPAVRAKALPARAMVALAAGLQSEPGGAHWRCANVSFGAVADRVLASIDGQAWLLDAAEATRQADGVPGSLSTTLRWPAGSGRALGCVLEAPALRDAGAALHAALIAGAMKRSFELTLRYGNDRVQFGKPIGKFQAVQHQLSVMAQHVAAATIASEAAFRCERRLPARLAVAVAKARCSEAAQRVADIAHAVHGAIGVTAEYDLQLCTRRLHEWRMADGSESYWQHVLGEELLAAGAPCVADFARAIEA
jgi:alkylation response protein AidB-like acyl-CoA dehydrogenase